MCCDAGPNYSITILWIGVNGALHEHALQDIPISIYKRWRILKMQILDK